MNTTKGMKRQWLIPIILITLIAVILPQYSASQTVQASGATIVVNPGHLDGVDPGAVNSSLGIREVDVNNALAIKVVTTLRNAGYNAMLSHPIPNNPGLPTLLSSVPDYNVYSTTICNTANEIDADLLISIHHNSGSSSSSGVELYWSSYHPSVDNDGIYQAYGLWSGGVSADLDSTPPAIAVESKDLAVLFNSYFKNLGYVPSNGRIIERDDAITRKTSMPSVLIEAGYLSNSSEAQKLTNASNQQKMADQILAAINEWMAIVQPMTADSVSAKVSNQTITATVSGITAPNGISNIYFPTWSEKGGQDDLFWYKGIKQSDGSYKVEIDISKHNGDSGNYLIHCYGEDKSGKTTFLGSTAATIGESRSDPMSAEAVTATAEDGIISVSLTGITSPNGLTKVLVPTWSEKDGQDDLVWYEAKKQSDGSYKVEIDTADHKQTTGKYIIHCYGVDNYGTTTFLGAETVQVGTIMAASTVQVELSGSEITVKLGGISAPNGLARLLVPTWSDKDGQDDLIWYEAKKQSDGSYQLTIDIKDHKGDSGVYNIHCYGVDNDGEYVLLATKTIDVSSVEAPEEVPEEMIADSVSASLLGKEMTVSIEGVVAPNGIKEILVPTWSEVNGQDDLVWYKAEEIDEETYELIVDVDDHNGDIGNYHFHVYGVETDGSIVFLGAATEEMPELIPIAGDPQVTVDQLVEAYEDSGKTFPALYIERGVDLETFCQLYYDEAVAEGIRPEVAFAQMLLETGYLQYGGQVKVTQFNFAGLGAVDGGTGGFDFAKAYGDDKTGIQMGIRGHIQHLKCYANDKDLTNENVDPRWNEKLRGKAEYLYWLSIPNNPYGTGWASDPNYGIKLKNKIKDIME
ncbi:GBS Bsp-like repeat-containing protein [Eubacteriaceae bacterium ES3]|nr:GBS Bsp-like repeat-containing protein [Eubacteriaceae bacterium ES3]